MLEISWKNWNGCKLVEYGCNDVFFKEHQHKISYSFPNSIIDGGVYGNIKVTFSDFNLFWSQDIELIAIMKFGRTKKEP